MFMALRGSSATLADAELEARTDRRTKHFGRKSVLIAAPIAAEQRREGPAAVGLFSACREPCASCNDFDSYGRLETCVTRGVAPLTTYTAPAAGWGIEIGAAQR